MSKLRPELQSVLATLRGRIRRYVFLEGAALILAVLGGLFWFSQAVSDLQSLDEVFAVDEAA